MSDDGGMDMAVPSASEEAVAEPADDDTPPAEDIAPEAAAPALQNLEEFTTEEKEEFGAVEEEEEEEGEEESSISDKAAEESPPGEEGVDEDAVDEDAMEVEATGTDEPSPEEDQEDSRKQQEMSYSTRGRAADGVGHDPLERLAREALGELTREKPPSSSALRESFLSDSITEEERRTRTRYIPAVDGMHMLRKHEIKGDLSLARTSFSSAGVAGTVAASKAKVKRGTSMDVEDEGVASLDDDRASDILRAGTKTVEIGMNDIVLPSTAFIAPAPETKSSKAAPNEVEAVTAFNPPRPPESIGPKKRHRMLRWERRPADIEVDLNNYRKTVQRTREELKSAQTELLRLECVDNHLRRHFLIHLQCMAEEWKWMNKELVSVQQECVDSADLLTSRTRSRGAGKSSYAMRDVLTVLRTRGQEIETRGLSLSSVPSLQPEMPTCGIGGVGAVSLEDWDRSTVIKSAPIASSWILPGDTVQTPYGEGTVIAVFGESKLDPNEEAHKDLPYGHHHPNADPMETEEHTPTQGAGGTGADAESKVADTAKGNKKATKAKKRKTFGAMSQTQDFPLAPRVSVRLNFGVGFFPVKAVVSQENPAMYSDARLALRWKGIVETAATMGAVLDIEGMADVSRNDLTNEAIGMETEGGDDGEEASDVARARLLPFGAGMFPTANGRGASLYKMSFEELDKTIDATMFRSGGVLGVKDNMGVPNEVKKREDDRQELLNLRAEVLQLKNELYRQRRVRMLNERTFASSEERTARVESLVAEMRTDLKTLKHRLDEEVVELGISDYDAERILTNFYESFDTKDDGEASPLPKRASRRLSRMDADEDDFDDDDDDEQVDESVDLNVPRQ